MSDSHKFRWSVPFTERRRRGLFDGKGELRRVLTGVKEDDVLYRAFEAHLERWGPEQAERRLAPDAKS